jgi:hypothetical protein
MKVKLSKIVGFSDEPLFLFITLYPWVKGDISKIMNIIETTCDDYEFITLDNFFSLLNQTNRENHYFDDTRRSIASIQLMNEFNQGIMWPEGWILLGAILTIIIWYLLIKRKSQIQLNIKDKIPLFFCGIASVLYLVQITWVIFQNYWQWPALVIIPFVAIIYPFFREKQRNKKENYVLAALLIGVSTFLTIHFPLFIIIGAIGYFLAMKNFPNEIVKTMPFSISLAIIFSFFVWTIWIFIPLTIILILFSFELRPKQSGDIFSNSFEEDIITAKEIITKKSDKFKRTFDDFLSTFLPAILLSLTIIPIFYLDFHIINIKMNYNGYAILLLSILVPIVSYPAGIWLKKQLKIIKYTFPFSWLLIWISPSPFLMVLILILIQSQIYALALYMTENAISKAKLHHRNKDFAKNLVTLPFIIGLFIVIPPMIYTVYFVKLPAIILLFAYYNISIIFLISILLIFGIMTWDRLNKKLN